jgi:hypothetical protein
MNIQEFAKRISLNNAPSHYVEPTQLKKYWRTHGVAELEKVFRQGYIINYDKEIDWKEISNHKKQLWYESINH